MNELLTHDNALQYTHTSEWDSAHEWARSRDGSLPDLYLTHSCALFREWSMSVGLSGVVVSEQSLWLKFCFVQKGAVSLSRSLHVLASEQRFDFLRVSNDWYCYSERAMCWQTVYSERAMCWQTVYSERAMCSGTLFTVSKRCDLRLTHCSTLRKWAITRIP